MTFFYNDCRERSCSAKATMHRSPVSSSSIQSAGYATDSQTLEVEFTSGAIYRYRQVEPSVFDELMHASSKGRFMNARVRDSYPYERVA